MMLMTHKPSRTHARIQTHINICFLSFFIRLHFMEMPLKSLFLHVNTPETVKRMLKNVTQWTNSSENSTWAQTSDEKCVFSEKATSLAESDGTMSWLVS